MAYLQYCSDDLRTLDFSMNLCSLFIASVAPFEGLKTDGDGILRGSTLFPD